MLFNRNKKTYTYINDWKKKFEKGKISKEEAFYCNAIEYANSVYSLIQANKYNERDRLSYQKRVPETLETITDCLEAINRGEKPKAIDITVLSINYEDKKDVLFTQKEGRYIIFLALAACMLDFESLGYDVYDEEQLKPMLQDLILNNEEFKKEVFKKYNDVNMGKAFTYDEIMIHRYVKDCYYYARRAMEWFKGANKLNVAPNEPSVYDKYFNENGVLLTETGQKAEPDHYNAMKEINYMGLEKYFIKYEEIANAMSDINN